MKTPLVSFLSATTFAVSLASGVESISEEIEATQPEPCTVRAWVRAEDLAPDHISRGELRIKVPRAECANQITSVALRLQLDEFGEFKSLKPGAVIPEARPFAVNQTLGMGDLPWVGCYIDYDYQAHDDALSDPELWTVKAEERRAWTTEATLLENNPDLSQSIVTAFTVAVPAVNYPPVLLKYINNLQGRAPILQHSFSDLGYRYTAVVTFTDGRTEDVPAGHTTFIPSSPTNSHKTPMAWNLTFAEWNCISGDSTATKKRHDDLERCLPEAERSAFIAEITLEDGNVAEKGKPLKGRVTVRQIKDGSTIMFDISATLRTTKRNDWALAHAGNDDTEFYNVASGICQPNTQPPELNRESQNFASIFEKDVDPNVLFAQMGCTMWKAKKRISPEDPHFDFEIEASQDWPVDFASYYSSNENHLDIDLHVLYSRDVGKCMSPRSAMEAEMTAKTKINAVQIGEGLWDYSPVPKPISAWQLGMTLHVAVPITVVRGGDGTVVPARPIVHYLAPGAPAPVLRSGVDLDMPASFPVAQPVVTVEALIDTSARLMQPWSTKLYPRQQFMNMTDPTESYRGGHLASVLWEKKVVAEERGILPLRNDVIDKEENQKPFSVAP